MTGIETETKIEIPGYKIIKPIGSGGMATVYLALQESIDREVAIKAMSPALASDPSFSERFVKEARMATLSHPNIITVYDAGVSNGQNYIVMELATGGNLDTAIQNGLSAARVVEIIKSIASALHYSCKKGFIHRDVKPENILFKEDGSALLVDFGIAKAISSGTRLTMVGSTIGSPNYMSPEQARGLPLDGRSDLYSLGIVFYEALTGIKPYDAADTYVIGLKHISDPIPQLPVAYKKFQHIIDKLLAKNPKDRFDDGAALISSLDEIKLDEKDFVVIPHSEHLNEHPAASPAEFQNDEESTRLSPEFGERETVSTEAVTVSSGLEVDLKTDLDKTRVLNKPASAVATDDVTRVMSNNDKTVLAPNVLFSQQEERQLKVNGSRRVIVSIITIIILASGGFIGWKVFLSEEAKPPVDTFVKKDAEQIQQISEQTVQFAENLKDKTKAEEKPTIIPEEKEKESEESREIESYLAMAESFYSKKQFTSPENENAFSMYGKVLELDSNNIAAQTGIKNIADRYYDYAKTNYDKKKFDKAKNYIKRGLGVMPTHEALLVLNSKISGEMAASAAEKMSASVKSELKKTDASKKVAEIVKNDDVLDLVGRHVSNSGEENKKLAYQNLVNKVYYLGLSQCNDNVSLFDSDECRHLYRHFLSQWPVAIKSALYSESEHDAIKQGTLAFNKDDVVSIYQESINALVLNGDKDSIGSKKSRIALANMQLFQPIAPLIGVKMESDLAKLSKLSILSKLTILWKESINEAREKNRLIENKSQLIQLISDLIKTNHLKTSTIKITPFVSRNSFEITPFSSALHQTLLNEFRRQTKGTDFSESYELRGEYSLAKNGDILLDLWLFNQHHEVVDLENVRLNKIIKAGYRTANIFFNESIIPDKALSKSYGFPADVRIGNESSNALLLVGDETNLEVKLDNPGFYYIAVHVVREKEQFSYLLPLKQGKIPFVQVALRNQKYKYSSLGKFSVTAPTGVETIQLIAASINLDKYLPPYTWSEKYQQYIIDGSEGDIEAGISQVRHMSNQIYPTAHDKTVQWQERLLITTILEKNKL